MVRYHHLLGLCLVLFLALDALGLLFFSSPSLAYSAPAPTPTPRATPRRASPNAIERHVCTPSGGDFTTVQGAVDAASPGDVIKVASGTYTESKPSLGYNLYISKTVHIYGGYVCGSWTTQNPSVNVTTIRPITTVISVVTIEGQVGITPTLDGFTITGGGGGNHGGGIRIRDSNALINNNIITGNVAYLLGGGIWVQRGAPVIQNNRIENNRSDGQGGFAQGGGVQLEDSQATLSNNIIANNVVTGTTTSGGGIDLSGGPVTLTGNSILTNTATGPASSIGYGGGISMQSVTATLTNNIIQSNTIQASTALTTMVGSGGGVYITNSGAFTLTNNTVMSNTAGYAPSPSIYRYGGGIYIQNSSGLLSSNIISGNQANRYAASGNGGGIAVLTSTLTVQGGQISNNKVATNCEGNGGGLYAFNSSITMDSTRVDNNCAANTDFYGKGGGLAFINSPYTLTNARVTNNYSFGGDGYVGGLYAGANSLGLLVNNTFANNKGQGIRTGSALTITNSIVMSHTTGISLTASVPVSVTFNDFYANSLANVRGFSFDSTNLLSDPQVSSDYHLNSGSPAIDAGTHTNAPDHDMDGQPRAMIGTSGLFKIDIGADERTGTAQRVINLDTTAPDLTIIGPGNPIENPGSIGSSDWIGYSVVANDVTGDNRADLIFAAEDWAEDFDTLNATGRLFGLFNFGTRLTGTIDLLYASPNITVVSKYIRQHLGAALTTGDLNGDGKRDLIAGSLHNDNDNTVPVTPTVFAFWGGSGFSGTRTITNSTPADFMVRAPAQDFFAYSGKNALTTGDVNGNGVTDLVIGDYLANDGGTLQTGAAFVIFGSGGLSGMRDLAVTPADFTLYGPGTNAHLGSVAVGRVNAGLQLDLVARTDTTAYVILGPLSSGSRHLVSASADITITNLQAGGLAVADITGDGRDDLILGSGSNVYVIPGPLTSGQTYNVATAAAYRLTGVTASSFAIGNVTGDTKLDLILGSTSVQQTFVVPGGWSLSGAVSILDAAQVVIKASGNDFKNLGYDVGAGDLDNDGQPDLVVSTWMVDIASRPANFKDAGKVLVFYGNGGIGPPPLPPVLYLPLIMR